MNDQGHSRLSDIADRQDVSDLIVAFYERAFQDDIHWREGRSLQAAGLSHRMVDEQTAHGGFGK